MTTAECLSRDTLKQYLAGWVDEPHTVEIEEHLETCETCEQTVIELESHPDTIFGGFPLPQTPPSQARETNGWLRQAVADAEQLMPAAPPPDHSPCQPISGTLGPYELIRQLGHGGMGAVYLARHKRLDKHVAIKLLPMSWAANAEAVARFHREILTTGKLNHSAIVSATDAGEQDGLHYLVMEYVEGVDLSRLARGLGPLAIADACEMMRQVACGLSYAHAGGIVHRDVKPSNVMLNARGEIKILDFGLAQLNPWDEAAVELTTVGQLMGTLDYMAPEQAERPAAVDYRADLYALGATLFRLLTGRAPHAATPNLSPLHKLRMLAEHTPPRLDTLRPDAPPDLVQLVESLLARAPESRPPSAAHVAERLAPWCANADLARLAGQAREAVDESPKSDAFPSFPWPPSRPLVLPGKVEVRRRCWPRRLVAIALAGLLLLGGVMIVLETSKGQLIIESEIADLRVKVLSDGKVADDLQLETGATSTRLTADQYQIVLDTPSDSVTIENSEFVLKRGATVVARIKRRAVGEQPLVDPTPSVASSGTVFDKPVYEGKSRSEWFQQLARERSPQAIGQALLAIEALLGKDNAEEVTKQLVALLPNMDGSTPISSNGGKSTIDYTGFRILLKANPGREYFELLANLLEKADREWGSRILTVGAVLKHDFTEEESEPLLGWIERHVFGDRVTVNKGLVHPAADYIRSLMYAYREAMRNAVAKRDAETLTQRFVPLMVKSPHLGSDYWLSWAPDQSWTRALRHATAEKALLALDDPVTHPQYVAQAAMILTELLTNAAPDDQYDLATMSDKVQRRLTDLAGDKARLLQLTDVHPSFHAVSVPATVLTVHFSQRAGMIRQPDARAIEAVELLDLVTILERKGQPDFQLEALIAATRDEYERVARDIPVSGNLAGFPAVTIYWPQLENYNATGARMPARPITPREWIGFALFVQAAQLSGQPLPEVNASGDPDQGARRR